MFLHLLRFSFQGTYFLVFIIITLSRTSLIFFIIYVLYIGSIPSAHYVCIVIICMFVNIISHSFTLYHSHHLCHQLLHLMFERLCKCSCSCLRTAKVQNSMNICIMPVLIGLCGYAGHMHICTYAITHFTYRTPATKVMFASQQFVAASCTNVSSGTCGQ